MLSLICMIIDQMTRYYYETQRFTVNHGIFCAPQKILKILAVAIFFSIFFALRKKCRKLLQYFFALRKKYRKYVRYFLRSAKKYRKNMRTLLRKYMLCKKYRTFLRK